MASHNRALHERSFSFFSGSEYFDDLASRISVTKSGDRIVLATMAFQPNDPKVRLVLDELNSALDRGVTVSVIIDAFPFIVRESVTPGPLFYLSKLPRYMTRLFRARLDALESLKQHGGRYKIINHPVRRFMLPFSGRSHIKFSVINNDIRIGGCNLSNSKDTDIMIGWTNQETANWLCSLEDRISKNGRVSDELGGKDTTKHVGGDSSLLLDAGVSGQSIIFDKVLELIDNAEKYVYITCQYFPNDITIRKLAAARARGVDVSIVFNHPAKHPFPLNILHFSVTQFEKIGRPPELFTRQLSRQDHYIHAKLLATDKGTVIGSHNYVKAGVTFGTAEIALYNRDSTFADTAIQTVERQLKKNAD